MIHRILAPLALACVMAAQSNVAAGLDGRMTDISSFSVLGTNATEVGFAARNDMCNVGSIDIPWFRAMSENHPMFGFLLCREQNGSFVQISDRSFCKHAFTSVNGSGVCGPCQNPGTGQLMGINCTDAYGVGNNGDRFWLGPADEIDPWLGTWNHLGSYFDQGDPNVGSPGNADGQRSNISPPDSVYNRVTVKKTDLVGGSTYYYAIHLVHRGEALANRDDNLMYRQTSITGSGNSYSSSDVGPAQHGSILSAWSGATVNSGSNGTDDGRFFVASKVTPLGGGQYRYDYAVHNADNSRGGATFRVPVAAGATTSNFSFRDIDDISLNQWTGAQVGSEVVFTAPANNPQNWNTVFNFSFECDVAPGGGAVLIDQARIGPGALSVTVPSEIPGGVPVAFVNEVGTGCGGTNCETSFYETFSPAGFDLSGASMGMVFSGSDYTVGTAAGSFVAPTGSAQSLNLSDDDDAQVSLPFTLPYPGGSTQNLWVCSNGFVSAGPGNGTDFSPTPGELLNGADTCWAACWHDINPANGGAIQVDSSASVVRVTYTNVPSFNGNGVHTFQLEFLPSGTVNIYWPSITTSGNGYLVGWSRGNGATDHGNRDLSVDLQTGFSICTNSVSNLAFSTVDRPVLGTSMSLVTSSVPAGSTFAAVLLSLVEANPPQDLTLLGMPGCFGYLVNGTSQGIVLAPANSFSTAFSIPNNSAFLSVPVMSQSVTLTPGLNTLGAASSNALRLIIGAL